MANRAGAMKRRALALGLVVWLLLLIVAVWRDDDLAARAEAEQAPLSDNGYQIDSSGRYVAVGVLVYDKQTGEVIPIYHGSFAPPSPTPSSTPGTVPSATPPATNTPRPSATPTLIPSATPGNPTPTPESTALPTLPPGDAEKLCLVKVRGTAINERTGPGVSFPKTATSPIPAGSTVKVLEVRPGSGDNYLWGRNAFGWFVLREGTIWWVDGLEGATELCVDVPGWPAGLAPPAPIARAMPGVWVGPGANRDELIAFGARIKAAGQQPAATVYGEPDAAAILLAQGWHVALRAAGAPDCPEMHLAPGPSAQRFVARVLDDVGVRAHAIVLANECAWPDAVYARDWVRAAAVAATARGVRALVPIVWNPGAPELDWVPVVAEAYREGPIALLWGVNLYPARPGVPLSARGETLWTTWRYEIYKWQLGGVPIVATEFARGDGSEPPDFVDIGAWWQVAGPQLLWGTAWYAAMPLGHWQQANLRGRLSELARSLISDLRVSSG